MPLAVACCSDAGGGGARSAAARLQLPRVADVRARHPAVLRRRVRAPATGAGRARSICLAGAVAVNLLRPAGPSSLVFSTGVVGASWAVGRALRSRRELAHELHLTARRLAAEEDGRERLAVADERTRIARELNAAVARQHQPDGRAERRREEAAGDRSKRGPIPRWRRSRMRDARRSRRCAGSSASCGGSTTPGARPPARGRPDPGAGRACLRRRPPGGAAGGGGARPVPGQRRHQHVPDPRRRAGDRTRRCAWRSCSGSTRTTSRWMWWRTGASTDWPTPAMYERATLCDATLEVAPCPGGRTRMRVRMPRVFDGALA